MCEASNTTENKDSIMPGKADTGGDTYRLNVREEETDGTFFLLKDNAHEFTLGLSDILDCLKFAESEGLIPPIPVPWWSSLADGYPGHKK